MSYEPKGPASPASTPTKESLIPTTTASSSSSDYPPSLDYSLHTRRLSLTLSMAFLVVSNACLPILVFYLVNNFTHVERETLYGITTTAFVTSLFTGPLRAYNLIRRNGERSAVPGPGFRWWARFDVFQWEVSAGHRESRGHCLEVHLPIFHTPSQFIFGILFVTLLFTLATTVNAPDGSYPLFILTPSLLVAQVGFQLVLTSVLAMLRVRAPCRLSSLRKGDEFRPGSYFIWEDLTAVDGGGGAAFRQRIDRRYRESKYFRVMQRDLSLLMGFGGMALLPMVAGLTYSDLRHDIVFGVSLAMAVVWAGVGAIVGTVYCRWAFARELQSWKTGERERLQSASL